MSMFSIFNVSGSAVSAQSQRLNVVASNLANADAVAGPDGQGYKSRQPFVGVDASEKQQSLGSAVHRRWLPKTHWSMCDRMHAAPQPGPVLFEQTDQMVTMRNGPIGATPDAPAIKAVAGKLQRLRIAAGMRLRVVYGQQHRQVAPPRHSPHHFIAHAGFLYVDQSRVECPDGMPNALPIRDQLAQPPWVRQHQQFHTGRRKQLSVFFADLIDRVLVVSDQNQTNMR